MKAITFAPGAFLLAIGLVGLSACLGGGDSSVTGAGDGGSGGSSGGGSSGGSGGNGGGTNADSGTNGGGNTGGHTVVALGASDTGYVDGTNDFGILGAWYAYGDSWGPAGAPPGKCQGASHTDDQCSSITFPPAAAGGDAGGAGFPQTTSGEFCLKGKAAKVIGTPPDYSSIFGIGLGLDLNNAGGVKKPYSASSHGIIGFQFTLSGVPAAPGAVRVELAMPATDATGDAYSKTITADGVYQVLFTDLKPAFTLPAGTSEPPFDPSMIESIQFHIPTVTSAAVDVTNLCVSAFSVIKE